MKTSTAPKLMDGNQCINTSKTGHITITVEQKNGIRFKTLGKNVVVQTGS
jgi:hypothetical protein